MMPEPTALELAEHERELAYERHRELDVGRWEAEEPERASLDALEPEPEGCEFCPANATGPCSRCGTLVCDEHTDRELCPPCQDHDDRRRLH